MVSLKTVATGLAVAVSTVMGQCNSASESQLVGFGAGTTGGGSGGGTTVNSCSALESALEDGGVVRISGILSGCDILRVQSGTTILGATSNSGTSS